MAWIESHQELGRNPKTMRLARELKISVPAAVGHLHFLWWWALDFAQDGNLSKYDSTDISIAVLWDGDADIMLDALVKTGFVDRHNDEYAGKLISRREKYNGRRTPEYRRWRKLVFMRDDYTCQCCGQRNIELNAHHIVYFSVNSNMRTNVSNGITLCSKCHRALHAAERQESR